MRMPRTLLQSQTAIRTWLSALLLALIWLGDSGFAQAGDPRRVWKTIETEHFVIHYYEPLHDVAVKVARSAEHAHAILTPVFLPKNEHKIQVTLLDQTDSANGFASVVPFNMFTLYATAPESDSVLNDHDDWIFGLTLHEHTHVLHLDAIGGLPALFNKIAGKQWAPNQVMPRWIIEGLATYEESKRTSGGRTRSAIFDMNLRVGVLANMHLDIAQITNGTKYWPRGSAAYLHGSHFLQYVFDRYGDDKVTQLAWEYGSNPVPYGFHRLFRNMTGKGLDELYADWREHLQAKYSLQVEAAQRAGLRTGRRLTFSAEGNNDPRYTRDGKHIVWKRNDNYRQADLRIMPVGDNTGKRRRYTDIDRIGKFAMLTDGSIIASARQAYRTNYTFDDLFRWHKRDGRLERLTRGRRAKEPAVSPDESQVAFVLTDRSQSRLAVMPLQAHARHRTVWTGERFEQVNTPRWSPDGQSIAISTWQDGGYRDIRIVDAKSGKQQRITNDRANDIYPVFDPDGRYLYYCSDRSGIYNIYAYDLRDKTTWQVSNVLGGAFSPDVSPDGQRIVYQGFILGGYDLFELDVDPERWTVPMPFVNDRPDPVVIPEDVPVTEPRPYRPLKTLLPRTYLVSTLASTTGTLMTVQTGGSDVVGLHRYSLGATVDFGRADVNVAGSYVYGNEWPSLRLSGARNVSRRSGIVLDNQNTQFTQETYSLTAGASMQVLRTLRGSASLSLDYDLDWLRNLEDEYQGPDPSDPLPLYPELDVFFSGLALRFSYSDAQSPLYFMGPSTGHNFNLSVRMDHPVLGSDFRTFTLSYGWTGYKRIPWFPAATFVARVAGSIATTDRARGSVFALGGVPDQDIATAVIQGIRASSTGYLRGFPSRIATGGQYHLANLEYRQFLFDNERGISTLPLYLREVHMAALLDVGNAADDFDIADLRVSAGLALRLDMTLGYFLSGSLDVGYARGLTEGGIGEYWLLMTGIL